MLRADGPFEVLERVNDNAYKVNLPGDYGVAATFNVAYLSPYLEDEHLVHLRANSFQQGEDDEDQAMVQDLAPQSNQGNACSITNPQVVTQELP